jgi:hypothetical protein
LKEAPKIEKDQMDMLKKNQPENPGARDAVGGEAWTSQAEEM